jgi:hypothetical protein
MAAHLEDFRKRTMKAPREAQKEGKGHVLFTHDSSASRKIFQITRMEIRKIMRGKKGTPYIFRRIALIMVLLS